MQAQCRKCLLKDLSKEDYFKNVYEYIQSLSPALKAPDAEYQRRLTLCQQCEKLVNGMCALCGCFVEVRAAKRGQSCADTPKRWQAMEGTA